MNSAVAKLQARLEQEAKLVGEFLAILEDEAKVLEDGAVEAALIETTERKNVAADALTDAAQERNRVLESLGFEADGPGLAAAVEAHPELASLREDLIQITERARALNESNGQLIEAFLDHNQRALETLRRLTGIGDIYDASGRKRKAGAGKSRNIKAG